MGRIKPNPFAMQPGQAVSSSVLRRKSVQDPLGAAAEIIRLRHLLERGMEVVRDMLNDYERGCAMPGSVAWDDAQDWLAEVRNQK